MDNLHLRCDIGVWFELRGKNSAFSKQKKTVLQEEFTIIERLIVNVNLGTALQALTSCLSFYLRQLSLRAMEWFGTFYAWIIRKKKPSKTWHQTNIIAIPKSGKDLHKMASHHPIFLLSRSFKLLEQLILQSIRPVSESAIELNMLLARMKHL